MENFEDASQITFFTLHVIFSNTSAFSEVPVFSSVDANEDYSGSLSTLFEAGRHIGHIVLGGLSNAQSCGT